MKWELFKSEASEPVIVWDAEARKFGLSTAFREGPIRFNSYVNDALPDEPPRWREVA